MLRRMVFIKSAESDIIDELLGQIPSLPQRFAGLRAASVHRDVGGRSKGFDRLFVLDFADEQAVRAWNDHPAHQPIRQQLQLLAETMVFDSTTWP